MEVKIEYSQAQLDAAVEFIAANNSEFLCKEDEIRQTIFDSLKLLAEDPIATTCGTMGFILIADRQDEGFDSDENVCRIEIYVDPSLSLIDDLDYEDIGELFISDEEATV